jgi:hypothetical protein
MEIYFDLISILIFSYFRWINQTQYIENLKIQTIDNDNFLLSLSVNNTYIIMGGLIDQ